MIETPDLDARFREFREKVRMMAGQSEREAARHLAGGETSLELPFHDGETGSLELALDYLDEVAARQATVSANSIEEAYMSLLLSYKRMKGNLSALTRIIRTMQMTFDLPPEEEVEKGP